MEIKQLIVGQLITNCYLVVSKGELFIIDPGDEGEKILAEIEKMNPSPPQAAGYPVANGTSSFGDFHPRPPLRQSFSEASKGRGIPAAEIKAKPIYIINTHYHFDHTMANKIIKDRTGAEILIHEEEKDFIKFSADRFLTDGEELAIGDESLKVFHTPGHTKGGICLLGKGIAFTGDTLFEDGYGRTDLPGGSQKDIEESLKKLAQLLKKGTKIYPGHGDTFNI